jgi:hydroxymethylpyrimidine pyrophosphatase-like HAD family hydrolase
VKDRGIIFTDVDGTLVYHQKFHAIRELQRNQDSTFLVQDPITGEKIQALDVSVPLVTAYLAQSTHRLAHRLRERHTIIFTTGATEATMRMRLRNLDFADGYIFENGGRILDAEFQEDSQWAEMFHPYLEDLAQIKRDLEEAGWRIVDAGRLTFLQVKAFENPHRSEGEFQQLCHSLRLPDGFIKTFNLGNLTVIPKISGKGKAVAFYLNQNPELVQDSIGIGDDLNDLEFLRQCQHVYVLGSAHPQVLQEAHERGWYVSSLPHFQGIDEIMTEILNSPLEQNEME